MSTFVELKVEVARLLKDPNNQAVSAADIGAAINAAIRKWKKKKFWFNSFDEDVTLSVNDPVLPAPSGITIQRLFKTNGVVINYASSRWLVEKVSPQQYDAMNCQGKGIPFAYTYRDEGHELYYYPDAAYTARLRGLKDYDDLVDDADANDFTEDGEDIVLFEAAARCYAFYRQDEKMATYYENRTQDVKREFFAETNARLGTGRLDV